MMRSVFVATVLFTACDPEVSIGNDVDGGMCFSAGRTCESLFGTFEAEFTVPANCTLSPTKFQIVFQAFDGGMGKVTVGGNSGTAQKQNCTVVLQSGLIGPYGEVEMTYEPVCNTISGQFLHRCTSTTPLEYIPITGHKP